ncbi:helix-turn-helix transcriptional regulator [Rhizobium ruizarguesonis]
MIEPSIGLLSTEEVAKRCRLSSSYLEKLRGTGGGPVFAKIGRSVRYHSSDVDTWTIAHRRLSTSATLADVKSTSVSSRKSKGERHGLPL